MFREYLISVEVALVYPAGLGKDKITMLAIKGLVRFKCQMSKCCPYYVVFFRSLTSSLIGGLNFMALYIT